MSLVRDRKVREDESVMGRLGYHTSIKVGCYKGQHALGFVKSRGFLQDGTGIASSLIRIRKICD